MEVLGQTQQRKRERKLFEKQDFQPSLFSLFLSISRPHPHTLKKSEKTHLKKKKSKKKGGRKEEEGEGKAKKLNLFINLKSNPCINS